MNAHNSDQFSNHNDNIAQEAAHIIAEAVLSQHTGHRFIAEGTTGVPGSPSFEPWRSTLAKACDRRNITLAGNPGFDCSVSSAIIDIRANA